MTITKKKITLSLTAKESEWLWNKLEKIRREYSENKSNPMAQQQAFAAESLQDRIQSEGT